MEKKDISPESSFPAFHWRQDGGKRRQTEYQITRKKSVIIEQNVNVTV